MGGVSYFAEKGIISILSEDSKCRLVVTVKPKAPSPTEKGLQAKISFEISISFERHLKAKAGAYDIQMSTRCNNRLLSTVKESIVSLCLITPSL